MIRWLVVGTCLLVAGSVDARPKPGAELALADLAWPTTTHSARALTSAAVLRSAGQRTRLGKLAVGTRIAWKRIVAASDRCGAYLELEPRGWVCAKDLAPSDLPPVAATQADPAQIVDYILAQTRFGVRPQGSPAYDSVAAIERGRATKQLVGWTFLNDTIAAVAVVGGSVFVKTIQGYVAVGNLMARPASDFEGLPITASTSWPFAWAMPDERDARVAVRSTPSAKAAQVRELERRAIVNVLETKDRFARIGDAEWVAVAELRIAKSSPRPRGVRADERWLDVDLDQNVLVAYEGDKPVYATLVSTGFGSTPTSLHRIVRKVALTRLVSPAVALGTWDVPDAPFWMEFRKYYAVHGAYWHDSFGKKRGHGCVNVSPRDGRQLFDWTYPQVPVGWQEAEGDGTPIRIRNRAVPDPPWTDYDTDPPVPIKAP
ncbi:MAG: ErfK/YbiS/YcfS/YnhG family protein [Deltaproteobacteria bacterium]|nr:ErfK/YbiS/YcfS/YnhG family protein [Deltaproteobacteria bacterium]